MTGWKTYALAAIGVLLTVAHAGGYITDSQYASLLGLIGSGGLATLRMAVASSAENTNAVTVAAAPSPVLASRAANASAHGDTVAQVIAKP